MFCDYLGTDGLSNDSESEYELYKDIDKTGRLGKLSSLYSHFRPVHPEDDRKVRRLHPAGGPFTPSFDLAEQEGDEYVGQNIHLESHELFSQLQTITNLVKVGPRRGLFLSCVNIGDGLTRVWRDWLAERAAVDSCPIQEEDVDAVAQKRLLWADSGSHVGLRMRVKERDDIHNPVIVRRDEDPAVSYTLQYEGATLNFREPTRQWLMINAELLIRTTQLLLMVEQAKEQEVNHSGKAIVIGSWDT